MPSAVHEIADILSVPFQNEKPVHLDKILPEYEPHYEWFISPTYGSKSEIFTIKNSTAEPPKTRESFPVVSLITGVSRQISYKSKLGIGTDIV